MPWMNLFEHGSVKIECSTTLKNIFLPVAKHENMSNFVSLLKMSCGKRVSNLYLCEKNSLRPAPAYMTYFQASIRKIIETTGSLIERLLPKSIHAVTARGFEIKLALFVLACSINFLW